MSRPAQPFKYTEWGQGQEAQDKCIIYSKLLMAKAMTAMQDRYAQVLSTGVV